VGIEGGGPAKGQKKNSDMIFLDEKQVSGADNTYVYTPKILLTDRFDGAPSMGRAQTTSYWLPMPSGILRRALLLLPAKLGCSSRCFYKIDERAEAR
jgi:hypothetical protein